MNPFSEFFKYYEKIIKIKRPSFKRLIFAAVSAVVPHLEPMKKDTPKKNEKIKIEARKKTK